MHSTDTNINLQHQKEVSADKILIIHNNTPMILIGTMLACVPLAIVLWSEGYIGGTIGWICLLSLITIIRWLHYRAFNQQERLLEKITLQGKGYAFTAFLSGCFWGGTSILFFTPDNPSIFMVLVLTLVSMVGGSMASLSSRSLFFTFFAIPALGPLCIMMFFQDVLFYQWLAVGVLVFTGSTLVFSRNLQRAITKSLQLMYKNMELVDDLKNQTEAANKANNDKSRFIATASHDLRQPLHAVNLFLYSLGNKITTEDQQYDLNRIQHGIDSLGDLFSALLDISQLDSGAVTTNKINFHLKDKMQKILDQYSLDAEAKGLDLTLDNCDKIVFSDPTLFEQLIRNLLSNAIQYTEQGRIDVFTKVSEGNSISLHIRDTGIGIPEDDRENIFGEFFQINNPERNRDKGLGLGLAIVRRTAKLLDLPIQIHSILGKGTEFIIEIPLGKSVDLVVDSSRPPTVSTENKFKDLNILVIDNEIDILDGVQHLLESWGSNVIRAESAERAMALVDDGSYPQFILSDYRLPGDLNGCEVVNSIRLKLGDIPALIITGDSGVSVMSEIKSQNFVLLSKPIKPAHLRVAMTRCLKEGL